MPGWKSDLGRRLDALIAQMVPNVRKAVRWNSPFYGMENRGWFLTMHCFTQYVKVTFLRGASLRPPPPISFKDPNPRSVHFTEGASIDEHLFLNWVQQAAELPGENLF